MPVPHEWLLIHAVADAVFMLSAVILSVILTLARKRLTDPLGRMVLFVFAASFLSVAIKNASIIIAVSTGKYWFQILVEVVTASMLVTTTAISIRLARESRRKR